MWRLYTRPSAWAGVTPLTGVLSKMKPGRALLPARQFGLPVESTGMRHWLPNTVTSPFGQRTLAGVCGAIWTGAKPKIVLVVQAVVGKDSALVKKSVGVIGRTRPRSPLRLQTCSVAAFGGVAPL